jgi:hypothetical protein
MIDIRSKHSLINKFKLVAGAVRLMQIWAWKAHPLDQYRRGALHFSYVQMATHQLISKY